MSHSGNSGFSPGTAVEPTSCVELSISCRDLLDKDVFSRSDPMCVVYHQLFGISQWVELLRTEVIWDCLNPDFVAKVVLDFRFEEEQLMRFEIYDIDNESSVLENHDFLGFAETTLGQIVSAGFNGLKLPLIQNRSKYYPILPKQYKKSNKGTIIILAEELIQLKEEVTIRIEGHCMGSNLCCIFPSKIFFIFSKINESGNYTVIYKSESEHGENPIWKPMTISMNRLCNGDKDRLLQIQCYREGINGYHTHIGKYITTFNKILDKIINMTNDEIYLVGKNGMEKRSRLFFRQCKILPIHTFVEYIRSGTQIHCCFAIDFTASNGDPNEPNSLHYFSNIANRSNPYEQAIQSVGDIIQDYDQTKHFPVYGFGARIPPAGVVSHKFSVNLNQTPFCDGISGVLDAYSSGNEEEYEEKMKVFQKNSLILSIAVQHKPTPRQRQLTQRIVKKFWLAVIEATMNGVVKNQTNNWKLKKNCIREIQLAGPTNFAPIINDIATMAKQNLIGQHYYVLLMITDGIINDMPLTKEAIVNASTLPLSIIIVGVGGANFDAMDELDGDIVRVSYGGKMAARDIVQFIPYRDAYSWLATSCPEAAGNVWSSSLDSMSRLAKLKLAQEVLAEIPEQLTSFMKSHGIAPLLPKKINVK